MKRLLLIALVLIIGIAQVVAQGDCPAIVESALEATDAACTDTNRNQACYGNVNMEAEFDPAAGDLIFEKQGDIVNIGQLRTLRLSSMDAASSAWGVALMRVQANLPDTLPGQNVTFLLFGDVEIENAAVEQAQMPVSATASINVRGGPSTNDAVIGTLAAGESVTANGRLEDGSWLRIALPDGETGWVFAQLVTGEGDLSQLAVVTADDAVAAGLNPMQAFYFRSGVGDSPCSAAPESGILIQTPEGAGEITFRINEVDIALSSTIFIQAQAPGMLTIHGIENKAGVSAFGDGETVVAGTVLQVPLDENRAASGPPGELLPYDLGRLSALPLQYLPRPLTLGPPLEAADIAALPTPTRTVTQLSQDAFTDPAGDVVTCDTRVSADDPEADIKEVVVQKLANGIETTKVEVQMQTPLVSDYSFAIMLIFSSGNTYHLYLWEVHAGQFRIGALNPQNGQLLTDGASQASITHDRQTGIVAFEIPSSELPQDNLQLGVQSFHTPTEETQPQPTHCDAAGLFHIR